MSIYGISGFVDGFLKGRGIRLDEKDRKEDRDRRAKLDELTFAQAARDAETHGARMGAYSREERDWRDQQSEEDRIRAEEAVTRETQRLAYEATVEAQRSADGGMGVAGSSSAMEASPAPVSPATLSAPVSQGPSFENRGRGAPPLAVAPADLGALGRNSNGLIQLPNGYTVAPAPSAAIADELYMNGPAGVRYLPPQEAPKPPVVTDPNAIRTELSPDYQGGFGAAFTEKGPGGVIEEAGKRIIRSGEHFLETTDGPTMEARAKSSADAAASQREATPEKTRAYMEARARGEFPEPLGLKPGGQVASKTQLAATAVDAMSEAATPAVKAAAAATEVSDPGAMGLKPGEKVTTGQRDRASKAFIDHYMEVGAPMVIEDMIKRGDFKGATEYQAWMDSQSAKQGMQNWAKAAFAASVGDMDGFADNVVEAYNRMDYFPDGASIVKDKSGFTYGQNGEISGARLTFKDEATGNTYEQVFSDPNDLVRLGITLLAPERAFEAYSAQAASMAGNGLTAKEARDEHQATQKRVDGLAETLFKAGQDAILSGGQPLTYEQARAQAEAAIMGGSMGAGGPMEPPPIMRRP